MCCVERFVRDAKILTMQNFRSVKVLVRCLELLRPSQTTSPHHILRRTKFYTKGICEGNSMIITKQKELKEILKNLEGEKSVFIIGCGECSTTCKTGGEEDIKKMKDFLEKEGKVVTGYSVPTAPCVAAKVKMELAKNRKAIEGSDSVLVLACGLGIQSVKENMRSQGPIHVGCDTLFMGAVDPNGAFLERCSACGDCVLELTGLICPVTRCPKSLLNGPCGGQNKGKCEVDKDKDCAWILIYNELKKKNKLGFLRRISPPKDHSKAVKPRSS